MTITKPRYVCIHGHFYQPPRENPWLEAIEIQESADPYHDWNERITAECYLPNSAARIQSSDGRITGIINNYARMSFNFGPTLLSWMESHSPESYQAIIKADKESMKRYGNHGSALAQVYNHIIMPLANDRDKETQIIWGLRDFEHRFGRKPEGMWLAEAAVDSRTLELLAKHGIKYTILAPRQARAVRPLADNGRQVPNAGWEDVTGGRVDPARAYSCPLPGGQSISLFFYDGPISQAIAFEGILGSGEAFAQRLMSGFSSERDYPQLLHVATDGETYGHHHKFGDMALAYALDHIEAQALARLTNYGQFLELHPPTWEAKIVEDSSWSCMHGVQRWNSDCGCSSGMHPGWTQQWRKPLRDSLDWLRDEITPYFDKTGGEIFKDAWIARNDYISVILDRSAENTDRFLSRNTRASLSAQDRILALRLMELQRQLMLMYTSCGWFFDELSGIETVQIMQYASRAIQLANQCFGVELEQAYIQRITPAPSNIPEIHNGKFIYSNYVKSGEVDFARVGAHYGVTSLFHEEGHRQHLYAFETIRHDFHRLENETARVLAGRVEIVSRITGESQRISFCVLHLGQHDIRVGVGPNLPDASYNELLDRMGKALKSGEINQAILALEEQFKGSVFTLAALFKDERRSVLNEILRQNFRLAEDNLRHVYDQNAPIMQFMASIGAPQPDILQATGRFIVGSEIRRSLEAGVPNIDVLSRHIQNGISWNLSFFGQGIEVPLNHQISHFASALRRGDDDLRAMKALAIMTELSIHLPTVNFWQAQNVIFELTRERLPQKKVQAQNGNHDAAEWVKLFSELAHRLKVKID